MPNWDWRAQPGNYIPDAPLNIKAMLMLTQWCGGEINEYSMTENFRPWIGIPIDTMDVRNGGICAITGCKAPASRMKNWNGKRIIDTVEI